MVRHGRTAVDNLVFPQQDSTRMENEIVVLTPGRNKMHIAVPLLSIAAAAGMLIGFCHVATAQERGISEAQAKELSGKAESASADYGKFLADHGFNLSSDYHPNCQVTIQCGPSGCHHGLVCSVIRR
jgi:hypothetical protein